MKLFITVLMCSMLMFSIIGSSPSYAWGWGGGSWSSFKSRVGSAAKSIGRKAGDKARSIGRKAGDKAREYADKGRDKARSIGRKAEDKAREYADKGRDKARDIEERIASRIRQAERDGFDSPIKCSGFGCPGRPFFGHQQYVYGILTAGAVTGAAVVADKWDANKDKVYTVVDDAATAVTDHAKAKWDDAWDKSEALAEATKKKLNDTRERIKDEFQDMFDSTDVDSYGVTKTLALEDLAHRREEYNAKQDEQVIKFKRENGIDIYAIKVNSVDKNAIIYGNLTDKPLRGAGINFPINGGKPRFIACIGGENYSDEKNVKISLQFINDNETLKSGNYGPMASDTAKSIGNGCWRMDIQKKRINQMINAMVTFVKIGKPIGSVYFEVANVLLYTDNLTIDTVVLADSYAILKSK